VRFPIVLTGFLLLSCHTEPLVIDGPVAVSREALDAGSGSPMLSSTRKLRKLFLTLKGTEPTLAEYAAAQSATQSGTFDSFYNASVAQSLSSTEFYNSMLLFGRDYLRVGDYKRGTVEGTVGHSFKGNSSIMLLQCPSGTLNAGAFAHFALTAMHGAELDTACDNAATSFAMVEPWWAPQTQVKVLGRARLQAVTSGTVDCGLPVMTQTSNAEFAEPIGCGCGPNLIYCYPTKLIGQKSYPNEMESHAYYPTSLRRLVFEEPARLFAHVVTTDAPFTDLVLGDYTVAPRKLQHMYVRWARMNTDNGTAVDTSTTPWWRNADDTWKQVKFSALHPNLLDSRNYQFDPRTALGAPLGIPSAGVLTQLAPNSAFPRERVRAARYLEIFACKIFAAPDPSLIFTPPYIDDPARQGACQHCHQSIDPAAIHFKRLEIEDNQPRHHQGHPNLGGIGSWQWNRVSTLNFDDPNSPGGKFWFQPYGRWNTSFTENTMMTPASTGLLTTKPDARFLDFLPPTEKLLGQTSDGTIGPLGFAKLIVSSGHFDRCAVQKIFARVMGRQLDLSREAGRETVLTKRFVDGGRKVKPFIESLVKEAEFGSGL
jgi:hypothetical protein